MCARWIGGARVAPGRWAESNWCPSNVHSKMHMAEVLLKSPEVGDNGSVCTFMVAHQRDYDPYSRSVYPE